MATILNERNLSDQELEKLGEEPNKPPLDPELDFMIHKKISMREDKPSRYRTLTREDVRRLMEASETPVVDKKEYILFEYPTYPREVVEQMVREHFEYKEEEKRKAEQWASKKMTASEEKIERRTRHSTSSKD